MATSMTKMASEIVEVGARGMAGDEELDIVDNTLRHRLLFEDPQGM